MKYRFDHWEDGSTNPTRQIDVKTDITLIAYYKEVIQTELVTFVGTISAQEKEAEVVTVTVTKPDGTTESLTTPSKADLSYGPLDYSNIAGDYKAKARIEADALYQPAESIEVAFSIGKMPRTITLTVT